jgi:hypothetical protein
MKKLVQPLDGGRHARGERSRTGRASPLLECLSRTGVRRAAVTCTPCLWRRLQCPSRRLALPHWSGLRRDVSARLIDSRMQFLAGKSRRYFLSDMLRGLSRRLITLVIQVLRCPYFSGAPSSVSVLGAIRLCRSLDELLGSRRLRSRPRADSSWYQARVQRPSSASFPLGGGFLVSLCPHRVSPREV